ncbi:induced myeloid leukemia cell differentiation protein Mcl-1 [Panthera pardus]|uniref:MCL1 apoptosis regulator, BCL2 family member n=4 Tax=Felidae TaxID=9681 RepID=A0A8C8Y0M9_PANLE|nr:induced myeloid leukemia cell differentiation protein Mcl-1 [Panthera tigris]XP_019288316.1 induced myeloid leukemia cell differentiation protein Mcl-1 [Panthera pardus]XP_025768194.1 induced myeloid leukemia cell differentiation protein Mcl-1 isoform X1 [Puma concolor]XP_030184030.1 induced myeloid leukemia cell differentiation protein Mcl-1 [Lynx canadensis]XP_042809791.1 induced myeloid leukemia cell differentiation protein Mcl-1 [Panthera leo]XP_043432119.1 induced myeloid leukemia cell
MFGLKRNAVIGLNLYCGGAGLAAGSGGASSSGGRLVAVGKEATARREVGGGEAGAVIGGSAGASPPATLAPDARRVARPSPIGAEGPDVTATPPKLLFFAATRCASPPEKMEGPAADAIMSPEEELDGYEPEPLGKRPAVLPLLELVGEASSGPGTDGSLPSTPPPAEEEEDELFRQSLEIISRYLREQATGAKDAKPLGGSGAASRKALETLRRVGDGVQRNHETAFQGMLRKLDIKNEDDVKSLSRVMVHVFSDGVTNWGRIVTLISFGAFVAKHLKSINQESCIEPLAESITDVLVRTKRDWLVKQRGWDGFVEFFHVEDLEGGIRNVLLAFAGVAGVGAGLAYLIR